MGHHARLSPGQAVRRWCRLQESNPRHPVYKTGALPTELNRHSAPLYRQVTPNVQPSVRAMSRGEAGRGEGARVGEVRAHAGGGDQRVGLVVGRDVVEQRGLRAERDQRRVEFGRRCGSSCPAARRCGCRCGCRFRPPRFGRARSGPSATPRPGRRDGGAGASPKSSPWRPAPRRSRHRRWRSCARRRR